MKRIKSIDAKKIHNESSKWYHLILCGIFVIAVDLLIKLLLEQLCMCGAISLDKLYALSYESWLAISYSTIFLSTSLLGMLSDKSSTVLWVNVNEYSLIKPKFFNFYILATIGFVSLGIETLAVILKDAPLMLISFSTGIFSIITIFYKMTATQYNRNRLRNNLIKQFKAKVTYYKKKIDRMQSDLEKASISASKDDYIEDVYQQLCKTTEDGCQNGKLSIVRENIEFYAEHLHVEFSDTMRKAKLKSFVLLLNKYGFLDQLVRIAKNDKFIDSYLLSIICAEVPETREIWNQYKESFFWECMDERLNALRAKAHEDYDNLQSSCDYISNDDYFSDSFYAYQKEIIIIARILCQNRSSETDMTRFLVHRIGEMRDSYDEKTLRILRQLDPVCRTDGITLVGNEHMNILCFLLEDKILMNESGDMYLKALYNIVTYEQYVKTGDDNNGQYVFLLNNELLKKVLYDAIYEYIVQNKKILKSNSLAYEILETFVAQPCDSTNVSNKITQLKNLLDLYKSAEVNDNYRRFLDVLFLSWSSLADYCIDALSDLSGEANLEYWKNQRSLLLCELDFLCSNIEENDAKRFMKIIDSL